MRACLLGMYFRPNDLPGEVLIQHPNGETELVWCRAEIAMRLLVFLLDGRFDEPLLSDDGESRRLH